MVSNENLGASYLPLGSKKIIRLHMRVSSTYDLKDNGFLSISNSTSVSSYYRISTAA